MVEMKSERFGCDTLNPFEDEKLVFWINCLSSVPYMKHEHWYLNTYAYYTVYSIMKWIICRRTNAALDESGNVGSMFYDRTSWSYRLRAPWGIRRSHCFACKTARDFCFPMFIDIVERFGSEGFERRIFELSGLDIEVEYSSYYVRRRFTCRLASND